VTSRIEKWFTSLGFSLRKSYKKIVTAKPSVFIIAILVVALSVFLLGGGIYDILEQPLSVIPFGTSGVLFFYPYTLSAQAVYESIGVMIIYSLGVAGILLMYQSTKYAYKPRQAFMLLLVGMVLILIAYFYVENIISLKMNPPQ
jgi:hypothetical protein